MHLRVNLPVSTKTMLLFLSVWMCFLGKVKAEKTTETYCITHQFRQVKREQQDFVLATCVKHILNRGRCLYRGTCKSILGDSELKETLEHLVERFYTGRLVRN